MNTTPTELALFKINVKNLSVEMPDLEHRRIVKFKFYVDDVEQNKGLLTNSKTEKNIWNLDSAFTILASEKSGIRLSLSSRHLVCKRAIASFQFISAALLSGSPSGDRDSEEATTFSITDTDHNGITLRAVTASDPEPINDIAHRLLEGRNLVVENLKKYKDYIDVLYEIVNSISNANSFAQAAVGLVDKIWKKCKNVLDLDDAFVKLLNDIVDLIPDLASIGKHAKLSSLKETLAAMEKKIIEAVIFIDNFRSANLVAKTTRVNEGNKIVDDIKELSALLQRKINVQQFQQISEAAKKKLLETLNPVSGADTKHQHHPCLAGTRSAIIEEMTSWVFEDETTIFWLNGLPGVGKSTITCSVVESLRASGVSTIPFFCQRKINNYNDATRIVQTMIYYLACFVPQFGDRLLQILDDTRRLDSSPFVHYSNQLRDIVHDALEDTQWDGHAVLLVDALDECADQSEQVILATELSDMTQRCNWLKVMITSRPYKNITRFFTTEVQSRIRQIDYKMSPTDPLNLFTDLVRYTEHCFESSLKNDWEKIESLARRANGLFQWVTVASQFVEGSMNKKTALSTLLNLEHDTNEDAMEDLYTLYRVVLTECLNLKFKGNASAYSTFLATVIALKTPLNAKAMSALADNLDSDIIDEICKSLRSVINIEEGGLVVIAHQSFSDYLNIAAERMSLSDAEKDKRPSSITQLDLFMSQLRIDTADADANLASKCIEVMLSGLKFNICALETSAVFNEDIPDLQDKITNHIPVQLQYACLHWLEHYGSAQFPNRDEANLMKLLSTEKILFWLEVLSLTGKVEVGMQIAHLRGSQEVETLTKEVHNFIKAFVVPIARSTPHLYLSALPFVPRQSTICRMTRVAFRNLADVTTGCDTNWSNSNMVLQCHYFVNAVAVSSDGRTIAAASVDRTIRLWDVQTGTTIGEPLKGHHFPVMSVAFSSDGAKIVSGSWDGTIIVWNVKTGALIGKPLKGHSLSVNSVAFSPDGTKIVSGSSDRTVTLWDVQTGSPIGKPLKGHLRSVASVAFSPDGTKIVSGSHDEIIMMWDVQTENPIGDPLSEHSSAVNSVAFSPDGSKIVSGSFDRTIRVWDVQSGIPTGEPLKGHLDNVNSVAFSYDGTKIVSGSMDRTIMVWNVETGALIGKPLKGHTLSVNSVAFSPDGTKIVSGSSDKTVRVWDIQTGSETATDEPLVGPSDHAVAFSNDGAKIASGSKDMSIRIWDAQTGTPIGKPLKGHTDRVSSIAFSPDGTKLVSGSWDATVRVWNVKTGALIKRPLRGHRLFVNTVAFSYDGTKIVSGSVDSTIMVWNVQTGAPIGTPLRGHSSSVESVAFSPDDTKIVSGSSDRTVRLWDVQTGSPIGKPLKGHLEYVCLVAFSSDGTKIVSGSRDDTIRIWDVQTGKPVGFPLEGHFSSYLSYSVAFSLDGSKIVSGASDNTVRMWDAQTGIPTGDPLIGHTDTVKSVAISPDGAKIVSGSSDGTIRVWNVEAEPDRITSTAFSVGGTHLFQWSCRTLEADGWMYLEDRESPLLWIPTDLRRGVQSGSLLCIGGRKDERVVTLDFSNFVYGDEWTDVYNGP